MRYSFAYRTDIGTTRKVNQDALVIKTFQEGSRSAVMVAVCDGMGGMARGEEMSRISAVMASDWFDQEFRQIFVSEEYSPDTMSRRLLQMINNINAALFTENQKHSMSGGTTFSMLLLTNSERFIVHVGDSRIYEIEDNCIRKLTKDHSFVAREVECGRMTEEEAMNSDRQNILLQCLGTEPELQEPQLLADKNPGTRTYLLCTDGFWHNMNFKALRSVLSPSYVVPDYLGIQLEKMIDYVKDKGETDNVTAVAVCVE